MNFFKTLFLKNGDREESEALATKLQELESQYPVIAEKLEALKEKHFDLEQAVIKAIRIGNPLKIEEAKKAAGAVGNEIVSTKFTYSHEQDEVRGRLEAITRPVISAYLNRIEGLIQEVRAARTLRFIGSRNVLKDLGDAGETNIKKIRCTTNERSINEVVELLLMGREALRKLEHQSIVEIESTFEAIIGSIPKGLKEEEIELSQSRFNEWQAEITESNRGVVVSNPQSFSQELGRKMDSVSSRLKGLTDFNELEHKVKKLTGGK